MIKNSKKLLDFCQTDGSSEIVWNDDKIFTVEVGLIKIIGDLSL